ncbi:MAG: hypothetical protein IKY79_09640 [Bacteroidales bacterium]|nr:hypothetical protein [Bacteroidales bacterium]
MKLISSLMVLLVCTFSLKATQQKPDYIIREGKKYKLEVDWAYPSPMDTYFIRTQRKDFFRENAVVISTNNWRAHVATWEIRDSKLYLLNVSVEYIAGYDTVEYSKGNFREKAIIRDTIHQPRYYSINSLSGEKSEADGAVVADWFTGMLNIDNRGADSKWDDEYKGTRYIYVKDGKVVDDQLLLKEDYNRIENITEKDSADHEFMKKHRMYHLYLNYVSYWIQSGTHDIMFYNGNEVKVKDKTNTSLIKKLYNGNHLEFPYNWENLELSGVPSALYSIEGDSIFLKGVMLCSGLGYFERDETYLPLTALFNEEDIADRKVFANWVSGDVYLNYGKTICLYSEIESFFIERVQKIVFDSGRVVGMEWAPCDFNSDIVGYPVSVCDSSKMYASNEFDFERRLEYYSDTLKPKASPYWADGDSALNTWFGTQTIDIERDMIWNIAFVVNCKGEAGGWTLITDDFYGEKSYERLKMRDLLFDVLSKLPNKWVPATDENGNPVDCRMILDVKSENKKLRARTDMFSWW